MTTTAPQNPSALPNGASPMAALEELGRALSKRNFGEYVAGVSSQLHSVWATHHNPVDYHTFVRRPTEDLRGIVDELTAASSAARAILDALTTALAADQVPAAVQP